MPKARLMCISEASAAAVVAEYGKHAEGTVTQDGVHVIIYYQDPQLPVNIAYWASDEGHATDVASARVISSA
jgi:hypothetical protein